jgi:2-polyprenyl-3-methyl-5-hydroxy-6-metoxy-1,4-benzoquinol methylase
MNHLSYYQYQTTARGINTVADVKLICANHRHFYDQIVRPWLPNVAGCRVAELACGHGSFLHWLSICGFSNVIGVDMSAEQTRMASQICGEVLTEDAIPWLANQPDSSLDVIVGIDFAEHISKDDFMSLLHQSERTLKPGGKLILRLPNGGSPLVGLNLFNDITHVWTYTPNCLATLGRMHGLNGSSFEDESSAAIRDHRWLKVPLALLATWLLDLIVFSAAKVRVRWWSPHLWACLVKEVQ